MKAGRQKKILELIRVKPVETQEELARLLQESGYHVTQATVSRDIKEMGLIKVAMGPDRYRYDIPGEPPKKNVSRRLLRLFQDSVTQLDYSENLVVIRTLPGTAHAVAACIDNMTFPEVIGTVAGDDTIMVIVKPKEKAPGVLKRFRSMLG